MKKYNIEEISALTEKWLFTGELNQDILHNDFIFTSPFWGVNTKSEFIEKLNVSKQYKDKALDNIISRDNVVTLKSDDCNFFAIVFTYQTKNGTTVDETVMGKVESGKLISLKSIYDLEKTKVAHGL